MPDTYNQGGTTKGFGEEGESTSFIKEGKSWFFGVGINHYLHFPNLNNAVRDVKDVLTLLQSQYGMDPERTITLFEEEATRDNIIDKLDELVELIGQNDKLIIYYSGHGHLKQRTNLAYWIPQDARKDRTSGYIPNSTVRDYIKSIKSRHTLLISDSCFSGTLFVRGTSRSTEALHELEQRRSRWGIVSGRHDEEVYDGEPGTHSPFAASIMKVLQRNRDNKLNVARLADRVVEMTRANYTQLPEGNPLFGVGHEGGQYVFRLVGSEANIWERCKTENSLAAYNAYLDKFPNGPHADKALQQIRELEEEKEWAQTSRANRIYAYRQFLLGFPGGKYATEARNRIHQLQEGSGPLIEQRRENPTELKKPANNVIRYWPYALGGLFLVLAIWSISTTFGDEDSVTANESTIDSVENQTVLPPTGGGDGSKQSMEKTNSRPGNASVTPKEDIAKQEEKRENTAWSTAQSTNTIAAYKQYLQDYPNGRYAANAKDQIAALSFPKTGQARIQDRTYTTIQFEANGLTWMAENLNLRNSYTAGGFCYDNKSSNCSKYGKLYTWEKAINACRSVGWRLPTDQEWRKMAKRFGGADGDASDGGKGAYKALMTDGKSSFSAQLGGDRRPDGEFSGLGEFSDYWTATSEGTDKARVYYFVRNHGKLYQGSVKKDWAYSVRCVQD